METLCETEASEGVQLSDRQKALMRSSSLKRTKEITEQYGIANGILLGRGGFGSVYKCKNFATGQMCALKIVRKQTMSDSEEMMRLID